MDRLEKPKMAPLHLGDHFKVLEVSANAAAEMPLHYCTSEAVINIHEGRAILIIDGEEKEMLPGMCVVLPANKVHSLKVVEAFKAFVTMAREASIQFAA
jgi:quercetin dioxygenase-like cupin family protein